MAGGARHDASRPVARLRVELAVISRLPAALGSRSAAKPGRGAPADGTRDREASPTRGCAAAAPIDCRCVQGARIAAASVWLGAVAGGRLWKVGAAGGRRRFIAVATVSGRGPAQRPRPRARAGAAPRARAHAARGGAGGASGARGADDLVAHDAAARPSRSRSRSRSRPARRRRAAHCPRSRIPVHTCIPVHTRREGEQHRRAR